LYCHLASFSYQLDDNIQAGRTEEKTIENKKKKFFHYGSLSLRRLACVNMCRIL